MHDVFNLHLWWRSPAFMGTQLDCASQTPRSIRSCWPVEYGGKWAACQPVKLSLSLSASQRKIERYLKAGVEPQMGRALAPEWPRGAERRPATSNLHWAVEQRRNKSLLPHEATETLGFVCYSSWHSLLWRIWCLNCCYSSRKHFRPFKTFPIFPTSVYMCEVSTQNTQVWSWIGSCAPSSRLCSGNTRREGHPGHVTKGKEMLEDTKSFKFWHREQVHKNVGKNVWFFTEVKTLLRN